MPSLEIGVNSLHGIIMRETGNDAVQELDPDLYQSISGFLGKLKREEYDGVERKIRNTIIEITTGMTSVLLKIRLEKAARAAGCENLLDEEKFILDANTEVGDRREMILTGILNGKSKLLEFIAQNHKTKSIAVRFLQEMDQIVGADMEKYGPFKAEDIATIPYENAQALMAKNIVSKIRWDD